MNRHLSLLLFIGLALGQYKTIAVFKFEGIGTSQPEISALTDQT